MCGQLGAGRLLERAEHAVRQPAGEAGVEARLDGLLAHREHVRQADPVRGEHARERVDQHARHAESVGDRAGVLAAGAAERGQHVPGDVVAALHRDLLDRVRHVRRRDLQEAGGHLLRPAIVAGLGRDRRGELAEQAAGHRRVQRLVPAGAEHPGKVPRLDPAEQHVGVGHRQRPAAAVAGRPGIGARRVGARLVPAAVEVQDRPAARRDRVDGQHRRAHPHPGDLGLVLPLELAGVVRDVRRRAAHVEPDHPVEAGRAGGAGHAHDAARWPGQDGVLAAEARRVGQPAVGLHEQQPDTLRPRRSGQLGGHLVDVPAQHRGQVGVHHGGVAPGHKAHQRAGRVRLADLGEADLAGDLAEPRLVLRVPVAVHADHGRGAEPVRVRGAQPAFRGGLVERQDQLAAGPGPLRYLDDPLVQLAWQHDVPVEDARPVLVADPQRVTEARGDHQHAPFALALEQRVRGHRGAEPDGADPVGGHRLASRQAEQLAHPRDGGVPVRGADRQQLVRDQ